MIDSILLKGKKFLSSNQAAKLVGYTTDYVGQLCRQKKVESQMIGRTWYVAEDAILDHKKQSIKNLTNGGRKTALHNGIHQSLNGNGSGVKKSLAATPLETPKKYQAEDSPKNLSPYFHFGPHFLNKAAVFVFSASVVFGSYFLSRTEYARTLSAKIGEAASVSYSVGGEFFAFMTSSISESVVSFSDALEMFRYHAAGLVVDTGALAIYSFEHAGQKIFAVEESLKSTGIAAADFMIQTGNASISFVENSAAGIFSYLNTASIATIGALDSVSSVASENLRQGGKYVTASFRGISEIRSAIQNTMLSASERAAYLLIGIGNTLTLSFEDFGQGVVTLGSDARDSWLNTREGTGAIFEQSLSVMQSAYGATMSLGERIAINFISVGQSMTRSFEGLGKEIFVFAFDKAVAETKRAVSFVHNTLQKLAENSAYALIAAGERAISNFERVGRGMYTSEAFLQEEGVYAASLFIHTGENMFRYSFETIPHSLQNTLSSLTAPLKEQLSGAFYAIYQAARSVGPHVVYRDNVSTFADVLKASVAESKLSFVFDEIKRYAANIASDFGRNVAYYFKPSNYRGLLSWKSPSKEDSEAALSTEENAPLGVVTIASSGNELSDSEAKRKIKESFSDEVEVIPDETGDSGIIRPVFKNRASSDFLYVLVPINKSEKIQ